MNKVTHIAKDALERLCDLLKIEQKILFSNEFLQCEPSELPQNYQFLLYKGQIATI